MQASHACSASCPLCFYLCPSQPQPLVPAVSVVLVGATAVAVAATAVAVAATAVAVAVQPAFAAVLGMPAAVVAAPAPAVAAAATVVPVVVVATAAVAPGSAATVVAAAVAVAAVLAISVATAVAALAASVAFAVAAAALASLGPMTNPSCHATHHSTYCCHLARVVGPKAQLVFYYLLVVVGTLVVAWAVCMLALGWVQALLVLLLMLLLGVASSAFEAPPCRVLPPSSQHLPWLMPYSLPWPNSWLSLISLWSVAVVAFFFPSSLLTLDLPLRGPGA